ATDPSPTATDPSPAATDPSRTAAADDVPWPGASSTGRTNAGSGTTEAGQTAAAPLAPAPVRETDPGDEVVVQRGDTLWAIAARHLGPDATVAEIAAEWPRWYATNRTVIGDDPDLILPGTILHPPLDD
ncbi:MAG: LysM peptidoglycan-binding domain-containing protein, partial [Actinomycetota bacterium]